MYGMSIPWMVFIVVMVAMKTSNRNTRDSFMVSGFFGFGISVFTRLLGWVDDLSVVIFVVIMVVGVYFTFTEKKVR